MAKQTIYGVIEAEDGPSVAGNIVPARAPD